MSALAAAPDAPVSDPRLIIPLDLPTRADAEAMVERLGDSVTFYKVGLQLLATGGMGLAKDLKGRGRQVFLDWKLHDIGATVEKATAAIAATQSCDLLTVHAEPQVMRAAVRGRGGAQGMKILGVTVLTSLSEHDLKDLGYGLGVEALVERRIRQALDAGIDGVVASPQEAAMARRIGGPDFLVVTPGVRPNWASKDDQARAAAPAEALKAGASHLVCGRPITAADNPRDAALSVVREMTGA
jgi:orotidine-5'-phosphate decarboxylase